MIKPVDIPEEIGRTAWRIAVTSDKSGRRHLLAATLHAAIEAGLVSPPVRILRDRFGVLETGVLYVDDNESQSHASPGGSSEHYRGQTE